MEEARTMFEQMIALEQGELNEDEIIALFQELVDNDMVWKLQGAYGRMAMALIDRGLVKVPERMLQ